MFLTDGPAGAKTTLLLAHGAGAPMDSASMSAIASTIAQSGFRVVRFEFEYMASRRKSLVRKPPPRAEKLIPEYISAIDELNAKTPLIIGGKSMGGRVASMIADDLRASGRITGLLCLGYPFHPVGKPDQLRTGHLAASQTPTLIIQGTRDPFGTKDEGSSYLLSKQIEIFWLEDGDHDLRPRKSVSGFTVGDHLKTIGEVVSRWANSLADEKR
jgi:predicted alpha/beta-hydrolase family hydrolase